MVLTAADWKMWRDSIIGEPMIENEEEIWERKLDEIPIAVIEKYLRKKKLQQLKKS